MYLMFIHVSTLLALLAMCVDCWVGGDFFGGRKRSGRRAELRSVLSFTGWNTSVVAG
ncbi:hypothetical protein M758_7G073000 [Ceratodon purpureus]|nr:hypothetical protein M758_7G073000 [Ceratodon purpureus]